MIKYKLYLFFALVFVFLFGINFSNIKNIAYNSPDENSTYAFSKIYSETGKLYYLFPENKELPVIHNRGTVILEDGKLVSTKFLGYPIIAGTIISIIGIDNVNYINLFLNFFIIFIFFIIIRKYFNINVAFLSTLLLLTFPITLYGLNRGLFEESLGIFFILMGYFFTFNKKENNKSFFYEGLFFGLACLVRPIYILYVIPAYIIKIGYLVENLKHKKIIKLIQNFTIIFISIGISLFILFYLNHTLYGGIFKTGYHLMYDSLFYTPIQTIKEEIIDKQILDFNNIKNNFFLFLNISIIILFGIISKIKHINNKFILVSTLGLFFNFLYIFGVSGSIDINFFNSPARYLLISFILIIPIFIIYINKGKLIGITIIILISIVNFGIGFSEYNKLNNHIAKLNNDRNVLVKNIPEGSYFFVGGLDKILFPYYKTIIIDPGYYQKVNKNFFKLVDAKTPSEYVCIIIKKLNLKENIYIYDVDKNFIGSINNCLDNFYFNDISIGTNYKIYKLIIK